MGTKQVTFCDGCGSTEGLTTFIEDIGVEFDDHQTENETIVGHLCSSCEHRIRVLTTNIVGSNMINTTRMFSKPNVRKILLMLTKKGYLNL